MDEKQIGKIQNVFIGMTGYQDSEFGLTLTLGSDKDGWGVCTTISGGWTGDPHEYAKWTREDQDAQFAKMTREVSELMSSAKVREINQLQGIPIEVEFDGMVLKDWRVLEEAL